MWDAIYQCLFHLRIYEVSKRCQSHNWQSRDEQSLRIGGAQSRRSGACLTFPRVLFSGLISARFSNQLQARATSDLRAPSTEELLYLDPVIRPTKLTIIILDS